MDPELRRYANGLFALLVVNVGVNLAAGPTSVGRGAFLATITGGLVYLFFVRPDLLHPPSSDE